MEAITYNFKKNLFYLINTISLVKSQLFIRERERERETRRSIFIYNNVERARVYTHYFLNYIYILIRDFIKNHILHRLNYRCFPSLSTNYLIKF